MTKQKKEKKDPVLRDAPEEERVRTPLFWVLLLAVPLMLGLAVSIVRGLGGTEAAAPVAPEAIAASPQPAVAQEGLVQGSSVAISEGPVSERRMVAVPKEEAYPCDFAPWVGLKVTQDILEAIKQAKRGYRILPPGAPMTMDYSAARINFDVDEKGTITRVWCG